MRKTGFSKAAAVIHGGEMYPMIRGRVQFFQQEDGVLVEAKLWGLPRTGTGFFAFHIHEGGSCRGGDFPETGGHFAPGSQTHPNHAGDLPPLLADFGRAYAQVLTGRFSVEEIIGKTVGIHSGPDDFHTQPSGNSGAKIACGVIMRV